MSLRSWGPAFPPPTAAVCYLHHRVHSSSTSWVPVVRDAICLSTRLPGPKHRRGMPAPGLFRRLLASATPNSVRRARGLSTCGCFRERWRPSRCAWLSAVARTTARNPRRATSGSSTSSPGDEAPTEAPAAERSRHQGRHLHRERARGLGEGQGLQHRLPRPVLRGLRQPADVRRPSWPARSAPWTRSPRTTSRGSPPVAPSASASTGELAGEPGVPLHRGRRRSATSPRSSA